MKIMYSGSAVERMIKLNLSWIFVVLSSVLFAQVPPTAIEDEVYTFDTVTMTGDLAENDLNPANSPLTYTLLQPSAYGELTVDPDGSWIFVPDPFVGAANEIISYQVCDHINQCSTGLIYLYVQFQNNPPQPADDFIFVEIDVPRFGDAGANDFEPDYYTDPISGESEYTNTSNPAHGDVIMLLDGTFQYTPDPGYTGTDFFYYVMCDACGACGMAVVNITVIGNNEEPIANNSPVLSVIEDTPYDGDLSSLVSDPEGDDLQFSTITSPSHGVVLLNDDGTFTYSPDLNYHGSDSFMYVVCDIVGQCVVAFVYFDVQDANDAPVALNDNITTNEDTMSALFNVAANDVDEELSSLAYSLFTAPLHGSAVVNANGTVTYTPALNYNGADIFVVRACDAFSLCDTSSVYVNIMPQNDPPVSVIDDYWGFEDSPISGTLDNDTDIDGDNLSYSLISSVAGGDFDLDPSGGFTFTPNQNYWGYQTITYQVCDPSSACVNGTLYLEVIEINDNPIINADAVSGNEDTVITGNLRTNDIEPDGEEIFYFAVTSALYGDFDLNDDGTFSYTPDENWSGTEVISIYGCDPCSVCFLADLTITVNPVNDQPLASSIALSTNEDTILNSNISGYASDVEPDVLTFSVASQPDNGTMSISASGVLIYTPNLNFEGQDVAGYSVCDAQGSCATATITINVLPINDAPVASDGDDSTEEDTVLNSSITSVYDSDDVSFTFDLISQTMHGEVVVQSDGLFIYTPDLNFNGIDFFTFEACDDNNACDAAVFAITVVSVNDAPTALDDDNVAYENDGIVGSVASNDLDVDGDDLVYQIVVGPEHGLFELNNDGSYSYTPDTDYNGLDQITYSVCDPSLLCDEAVLYLTIFPVNSSPIASDANLIVNEDNLLTGSLLNYVTDVEGGTLIFNGLVGVSNGTLSLSANGSFVYTPSLHFNGNDQFTFQVCDSGDSCDVAVVYITVTAVNDAPIVMDEEFSMLEDSTLENAVSENDSDVENEELTYSVLVQPLVGSVIMDESGNFEFIPPANYFGDVLISYEVCDPLDCTSGEILIHVLPVNDAPIALDNTYGALEDILLSGNVGTNDSDMDDAFLIFTLLTEPEHGDLTFNTNGSFTYLPDNDFNGQDSFTYQACDSGGLCSVASVTINVDETNDLPVAVDDVFNLAEDTSIGGDLSSNDYDPESTELTYTLVEEPTTGILMLNEDGTFSYYPEDNFFGQVDAVIQVCDAMDACVISDLLFFISPINDLPIAIGEVFEMNEDAIFSSTVADNDLDIEDPNLDYQVISQPMHGSIVMSQNGSFTYTPDPDYFGNDVVVYEVCDDDNGCSNAELAINVLPVNDNPIAIGEYRHVLEDNFLVGDLSLNDFDADGDELTYTVLSVPFHGEFVLNEDGTFVYTPTPDYSGMDSVYYNVCDPTTMCDMAVIVFEVDFGNDTPIAFDDSIELEQDSNYSGSVATNDIEPDGETLYFTIYQDFSNGIFSLDEDGSFTYIPNDGVTGTFYVTYFACDPCGVCDQGQLNITVVPIGEGNTPPVAFNVMQDVCLGSTLSFDLDSYVGDIQDIDANLHFSIDSPAHGSFTFDDVSHIVEYSSDSLFIGNFSFGYTVCDNGIEQLCTDALINLNILPLDMPVLVSSSVANVSCHGENDAAISLVMANGQNNLVFDWSNDAETEDVSGLDAGNYSVEITNNESCPGSITLEFELTQPDELIAALVSLNHISDNLGSVDILVEGGTEPYEIIWTGPDGFSFEGEDLSNIDMQGDYSAMITDANGCTTDVAVSITSIDQIQLNNFSISPNPCDDEFIITQRNNAVLENYQLFDATGRMVQDVYCNQGGVLKVSTTHLPAGVYQLRLNSATGHQNISVVRR